MSDNNPSKPKLSSLIGKQTLVTPNVSGKGTGAPVPGQVATKITPQSTKPRASFQGAKQQLATQALQSSPVGKVLAKRDRKNAEKNQDKIVKTLGLFSKIILIAGAAVVDIAQIVLDLFVVGVIVNRFIDIGVAILFLLFLLFKKIPISENAALYISVAGAFIGEEVPFLDIAPLWTLDAIYIIMKIRKSDKIHNEGVHAREEERVYTQIEQAAQEHYSYQALQEQQQVNVERVAAEKYSYAELKKAQSLKNQPLSYEDISNQGEAA